MPLRNPFKRLSVLETHNEHPSSTLSPPAAHPPLERGFSGFSATSVAGTSTTSEDQEPVEYQLSEIDDNGAFVPPAALPRRAFFWQTNARTTTASSTLSTCSHRSSVDSNEPFSISRESFDSYRRSFDISARSPVSPSTAATTPRRSLESSLFLSAVEEKGLEGKLSRHVPRRSDLLSFDASAPELYEGLYGSQDGLDAEEDDAEDEGPTTVKVEQTRQPPIFEEVSLDAPASRPSTATKKRGTFFSRLTTFDSSPSSTPSPAATENSPADNTTKSTTSQQTSSFAGFQLFSGRKRGQSMGQGAELASLEQEREMQSRPLGIVTAGGD